MMNILAVLALSFEIEYYHQIMFFLFHNSDFFVYMDVVYSHLFYVFDVRLQFCCNVSELSHKIYKVITTMVIRRLDDPT